MLAGEPSQLPSGDKPNAGWHREVGEALRGDVPDEPQLFLLDKLFALSGWDSSRLTLVIKSNCLATHGFSIMHMLKRNVHQKRTRVGRTKLFCQVTLLEIEAIAELKISGTSGGAFH